MLAEASSWRIEFGLYGEVGHGRGASVGVGERIDVDVDVDVNVNPILAPRGGAPAASLIELRARRFDGLAPFVQVLAHYLVEGV